MNVFPVSLSDWLRDLVTSNCGRGLFLAGFVLVIFDCLFHIVWEFAVIFTAWACGFEFVFVPFEVGVE